MAKIFTKRVITKNKGECIRIRHIYSLFGIPVYFRTHKISYAKEFMDVYTNEIKPYFKKSLWGESPTIVALAEYIVKSPDIFEKIQKLISAMSLEDTKKILKVIKNLQKCYYAKSHNVEVSDIRDIIALNKIDEFYRNIVEITPNIFFAEGYFLPKNYFYSNVFLHKHGLHLLESKTLEMIKHKDIIDVGGFIGDSAIVFEREFCLKKIYAFEATKTNYNLMLETLKLNDSKRIVPINKGLGSKNEILEISVSGGASTMNSDIKAMFDSSHYKNTESAEIITLDSYVFANDIDVGFIKVDIEGFEQEFLKGAKETIKKFKPAMLISIYHNASDFFNIKPLIESWNLGYSFKFDKPIDGNVCEESVILCEIL